ncbi:copper homeostasis protein CutC [Streptantibioticus silvisoli]|uniref:PF03932 family protein CutC n=1 Tax=Streptantibioticus silvisoli TaxID=2705255 RepID=A0ABT6VXX1_9ACTN|nr:copper homeostasis protein CutC [Streptantibioticus silvisoli]MDI5962298.1 copper homeostasis protein CutC [Streptantibioticus silvisoli]
MSRGAHARPLALEIAVTSAAGARTARDGGADRVELCSALELGGVTASAALVEAVSAVGPPVQALVRCRPGDFVYDADEVALMAAEVRSVIACGAAGVVVGALTAGGTLDTAAMRRFADAAHTAGAAAGRRVEVTLHRAVDQAADPVGTAALASSLGLTRVLTSGGAVTAADGLATLAAMAAAAPGLEVMAGAGVRPRDIARLAAAGAGAVHLSAKRPAPARRGGRWIPMGAAGSTAAADTHFVTCPDTVARARAAADAVRHAAREADGAAGE